MHNIDKVCVSMPEMCVSQVGELIVPSSGEIETRSSWIQARDAFDFRSSLFLEKRFGFYFYMLKLNSCTTT